MIIKKLILRITILFSIAFLFSACGSGNVDSFFMVTNTLRGNVCVNRLDVSHDAPEAKEIANKLYAYYGYAKGETQILSGKYVPCSQAKAYGSREPDLIIYADFYRSVIVPAVVN